MMESIIGNIEIQHYNFLVGFGLRGVTPVYVASALLGIEIASRGQSVASWGGPCCVVSVIICSIASLRIVIKNLVVKHRGCFLFIEERVYKSNQAASKCTQGDAEKPS
jgi:NhaP-type Na+/H+ or K+/H+ antiporter